MQIVQQSHDPPPAFIKQLREFDANARWAHRHSNLLLRHAGKFVAVDGKRIVAVAESEAKLRKRRTLGPAAYVTFVDPPGLAWVI